MNSTQENNFPQVRHDWHITEIRSLYDHPVLDLIYRAAYVHRHFHDPNEMQICRLISIKTGGCPEDCHYYSQSSHYSTEIESSPLVDVGEVLREARAARDAGVSRICLGAAWRSVRDDKQFEKVLEMVRQVTDLGLEVCCTLGMLTERQAKRLEDAGLHAYNHNIDTSESFYPKIITTRTFRDRLDTIENVRKTHVTVCCGGILGLGETIDDRVSMLQTLANMKPHPESVPINVLSRVAGTPLANNSDVDFWETIKIICLARILMPTSVVRLSAGRANMTPAEQGLCFLAGANSIFSSERKIMLTKAVPLQSYDEDRAFVGALGMKVRRSFKTTPTANE